MLRGFSRNGYSHQPRTAHACGAILADDDVVMNRNIELFRRIDDVCGEGDVLLAWAAVTAWVIVDHPYGPHNVLIYMIYFA